MGIGQTGGRSFYTPWAITGETTALDIFEIQPATNDPIRLIAFEIFNVSEQGVGEEEMLEIRLIRRTGTPTVGSGGGYATPATYGVNQTFLASGLGKALGNTTPASGGTEQIIARFGWNVRMPLRWYSPPEARIQIKDNDLIHLNLATTPADAISISGWILHEEQ